MFYFNTNRGTEFQNDILSSFIFLTVITSCSTYFNMTVRNQYQVLSKAAIISLSNSFSPKYLRLNL